MRLAILFLFLISAMLAQQRQGGNPHNTAADVVAGAKMFRSHCAECHGPKGEGGFGPDLTAGAFYHGSTDADLFQNITNGIEGTAMPGTFFDAVQVWQLVAYVRSLSQAGQSAVPRGDPRRGARLIEAKGCSGCHLIRGQGDVRGPDLSIIGSQRSPEYLRESIVDPSANVQPQYWVANIALTDGTSYSGFIMNEDSYQIQILDFSQGLKSLSRDTFKTYKLDKKSTMPSYKDQLSSDELNDLVNYLSSLKRERASE